VKHVARVLIPVWGLLALFVTTPLPAKASDTLVIPAQQAAVKTDGGPVPGGWNLWSNGRVGQYIKVARTGRYTIVIRAWGSPAGGGWPEMAFLVDELGIKSVTVASDRPADYAVSVELEAGDHEIAAAFQNDARIGQEDRNLYLERITIDAPPGAPAPSATSGEQQAKDAEDHERELVAATGAAIEKHRKSSAVVLVVDSSGQPIEGARVVVRQTGHEFLFGCNIYGFGHSKTDAQNALYAQRFAEMFNYATVGFYWHWYETQRGKPNYRETDKVVAWCLAHGIRMKGHPLLWADNAGIPPWSAGQPEPAIQKERVRAIMTRYLGKIDFFEVVNEPSHFPQLLIDDPYRWARSIGPGTNLIVNDYQVLADGAPGFYRLLHRAIQNGVPFDGIGIQAHEPRTMRFPLDRVQTILDRYAALGKKLHITEFTPTSGGKPIAGSHRKGVWDEAAQADYAVKFYRVCFAQPAMRAITWWDLSDQHSWLEGGGMLRSDMTPKPVYEQLKRLIHEEWTTRLEGTTDSSGRFAFRGFRGTYRIVATAGGQQKTQDFSLVKANDQELRILLR
jgi:GH35 family endo-1,4-beta-xylanase